MKCASQRSLATWRLRIFRQLAGEHQLPPNPRTFSSSRVQRAQSQAEASSERENNPDAHADDTRPSNRLPQSPLITHPRNGTKKQRKRQPTPEDLAPLAKNPWAVALASPARQCTITGTRIPRALLGEWGLVRRPETTSNYMLPVGLLQGSLREADTSVPRSTPAPSTEQDKPSDTNADELEKDRWGNPSTVKPVRRERLGPQLIFRMFHHFPMLEVLSKPLSRTGGKVPLASKLMPFRWKHPQGPVTLREEKQVVWMKEMPDYVLRHMRANVVKKLERVCVKYPDLGAKDGVWSIINNSDTSSSLTASALAGLESIERIECGAVLRMPDLNVHEESQSDNALGHVSAPEDIIVSGINKRVPVFDFSFLFSKVNLEKLREGAGARHFQHRMLFFRPDDPESIEAMLALWKLRHYIHKI